MIIQAFEELQKRRRRSGDIDEPEEEKTDEVLLLGEIRDLLRDRG